MSIRTTVTLDGDVFARLKEASASKGVSFDEALNDAVRSGLTMAALRPAPARFEIQPESLGRPTVSNIDNINEVIAALEGEAWR